MVSDWLIHRFCAVRQSPAARMFGLVSRMRALSGIGLHAILRSDSKCAAARPKDAMLGQGPL